MRHARNFASMIPKKKANALRQKLYYRMLREAAIAVLDADGNYHSKEFSKAMKDLDAAVSLTAK